MRCQDKADDKNQANNEILSKFHFLFQLEDFLHLNHTLYHLILNNFYLSI